MFFTTCSTIGLRRPLDVAQENTFSNQFNIQQWNHKISNRTVMLLKKTAFQLYLVTTVLTSQDLLYINILYIHNCWIYQLLRIHIYCSSLLHLVLQNCSVSWTSSFTKSTTLQSTEYLPIDCSNTNRFHSGWIQGWQHARYRIRNTDFSKYIYLNIC